jgi:hypothetical protein
MNDLSREACELVYAGREAFRPTDADRARVLAAITGAATLTVGSVAAASSAKLSVTALSGMFRAAHLARLLAITVPMAVGGTYLWQSRSPSPARAPSTAAAIARPVTAVALPKTDEAPAPPAESKAPEQAPSPVAPVSPERGTSPSSETAKPSNQMREEVALLSKAQRGLSSGHAQEALEALNEHATRFPRGALAEERIATRARALCALNRRQEGEAELKRMERLNPGSAYLARAREACSAP